jgi:hypothetical protein
VPDALEQGKRQRKRLQGSCEVEFSANNETYRGVSDNFSITGLFIRTDKILAPQSVVSIKVHLPDGSTSKLEGRVRRVERAPYDIVTALEKKFVGGVGIEIMAKDANYIKFFMSLLGSAKV